MKQREFLDDDENDEMNINLDDTKDDNLFSEDFGLDNDFGMSASPMERHNELLKELTNFDPYLQQLVQGWLGLVWDEKEKQYVKSQDSVMNERGAAWCVTYLKTYARKNNIITTLTLQEYQYLICGVIDIVWVNIGTRAEEFGIKTDSDIMRVCNELEHAAILVLTGAGEGKYNKLLKETTQRNENVSYQGESNAITTPVKKGIVKNILEKLKING